MPEKIKGLSELLDSKMNQHSVVHPMSSEEYELYMIKKQNDQPGKLDGLDCSICKNKGYYLRYDSEHHNSVQVRCECMARRDAIRRLNQSGLSQALQKMTFETYQTESDWTRKIYAAAKAYAATPAGWFFIGGQVGAGKTHICTAILQELLKRYPARYILWRDEIAKINAGRNDQTSIDRIGRLENVKVLYIDDLFKSGNRNSNGKLRPNPGEVNTASQILYARYNSDDLYTIISTELFIDELLQIDEGIGSRIAERSKEYRFEVDRNPARNWRTTH